MEILTSPVVPPSSRLIPRILSPLLKHNNLQTTLCLTQTTPKMNSFESLRVFGTPASLTISSILFIAVFLFYRWLLPKPIPGIPYSKLNTLAGYTTLTALSNLQTQKLRSPSSETSPPCSDTSSTAKN